MSESSYRKMLEEEHLRVNQLERELTQHKALIDALTALTSSPAKTVETKTVCLQTESPEEDRLPTYIRKDSLPLLRAIKDQALSADAIVAYCQQAGAPTTRETVLLRLGRDRRNYRMVENTESGLYQLTEKGKKYMEARYPEVLPTTENQEAEATDISPFEPEIMPPWDTHEP